MFFGDGFGSFGDFFAQWAHKSCMICAIRAGLRIVSVTVGAWAGVACPVSCEVAVGAAVEQLAVQAAKRGFVLWFGGTAEVIQVKNGFVVESVTIDGPRRDEEGYSRLVAACPTMNVLAIERDSVTSPFSSFWTSSLVALLQMP